MDDFLPQIESWLLGNYAQAAVITLCVADHIETWPREFSTIWKRRKTGTSVLFLVTRYMLLLDLMIQAISAFPGNGTNQQLVLDIWSFTQEVGGSTVESPFQNISRCELMVHDGDQYIQLCNIHWQCKDSINLVLHKQSSVMVIIVYIVLKMLLKIPNRDLVLLVSLKSGNINNFAIFVTPFFDILPNLLISRLMLNLRTYSEPGNTTISQGQQTHVSSLNFASNQMLGNIGAPLVGRSFNEEEGEEEERVEIEAIGGQHDRSGEPESLGVVVVKLT
ncbi:MAG: hypothetical protein NXY57DRAFT_1042799 [Lentinula lateritia]|nr:MAG: hypothetical protein NXY57DRAFT_1042799 [Lentinula lateritia]